MAKIATTFKAKLSEIIGIGHSQFGKVALRRPYRDDDDSGEGGSGLHLEEHPFLAEQQIGASSDLTHVANQNDEVLDEAKNRSENELSYQLKNQKVMRAEYDKSFDPKPGTTP